MASANFPIIPFHKDIYGSDILAGIDGLIAYQFNPRFSFQAGLGIHGLAYSREAKDTFEIFIQRNKEYYAQVPFGFNFYPNGQSRVFSVYAGVLPSYLLRKSISAVEENPDFATYGQDPSDVGRIDLSAQMGLSLRLSENFRAHAVYTQSFTSQQNPAFNSGRFSSFSIGLSYSLYSNENKSVEKQVDISELSKTRQMPDYVLVQLKTNWRKAKRYLNSGYTVEAEKLLNEAKAENKSTVEAFQYSFSALPVYFYYDTSATAILDNRQSDLVVNHLGNPVADSALMGTFIIAEFGSVYSETFGSSSGFGLVIYSSSMKQLKEPFPYYTPNYFGLVSRKDVVRRFNGRLQEYLSR